MEIESQPELNPTTEAKSIVEKNLYEIFAASKDGKRQGLFEFLKRFLNNQISYNKQPDEEAWKDSPWKTDNIVASWSNNRGLEIFSGITKEGLDIKHILYHEIGHALHKNGVLDRYSDFLFDQFSQIPDELHSQYIQKMKNEKDANGVSRYSQQQINDEMMAEILSSWQESDGSAKDFICKYIKIGSAGWENYLEQNNATETEELPVYEKFELIFHALNSALCDRPSEYFINEINNQTSENYLDEYCYDNVFLGQENYWPTATPQTTATIFDIIINWLSLNPKV